ncbi:MAG TPA: carbohydrate ABC transporter permease, partial [Bacillales bacterium]|nr:carbohydrate ABC transporter permease [Bacillales bacterium]
MKLEEKIEGTFKKTKQFRQRLSIDRALLKVRKMLLGKQVNDGLVFRTFVYALLISIGFIYLYPMLYMASQSFKSLDDLLDPTVIWIPKQLY